MGEEMKTLNQDQLETLAGMAQDFADTADDFGLRSPDEAVPRGSVRVPPGLLKSVEKTTKTLHNLYEVLEPCIDGEYLDNLSEVQRVFTWVIQVLRGADGT